MGIAITGISAARPKSRPTKFSEKITSIRIYQGQEKRTSNQSRGEMQGANPRISSQPMKTNFGITCDRKQNSEERQARLAQVDGVSLKGDFEQRRHGRSQEENKPPRFERGNTDRFMAQCPSWPSKKKRCTIANPASKGKGGETEWRGNQAEEKEKEKGVS